MNKCLFNGLEEGGVYQLRTSEFEVIVGAETVLSDFDKIYESYQNAFSLFNLNGDTKIVLIAETYNLRFYADDIDMYKPDEVKEYFNNMQLSPLTRDILFHMTEMEEFSVTTIVEKIAKPGQKINIQLTDTLYGNSEFDIFT